MESAITITDIHMETQLAILDKINEYKDNALTLDYDYYIHTNQKGVKIIVYNRSGWSKLALLFNITTEIISEQRITTLNKKTEKEGVLWIIKVKATLPNGRFCDDGGGYSTTEQGKVFNHGEHDVYATAITRAKGRAISGLIGGGIIFEELPDKPKNKIVRKQLKNNIK